jgi:hypothetical protein
MEVLTPNRKRTYANDYAEEYSPTRVKKRKQHNNYFLEVQLDQLSKNELKDILINIVKEHPETEQTVAKYIPKPTVKRAVDILAGLRKELEDAIPYNRLGCIVLT